MALAKTLWNKLNRNVALAHSKKMITIQMALAKTLWNKLNRNVALAHSKKDDNNSNGFSQNIVEQIE